MKKCKEFKQTVIISLDKKTRVGNESIESERRENSVKFLANRLTERKQNDMHRPSFLKAPLPGV